MPIYEFACPNCKRIYSFLSKRVDPTVQPICPKCGNPKLIKQLSRFSLLRSGKNQTKNSPAAQESSAPDFDDPRVARTMAELENTLDHIDENNPRHLAYLMRKMKEIMPSETVPKELDIAIKRLEAGEDPEKVEEDMGQILTEFMGGPPDDSEASDSANYTRDEGLYEI